VRRVDHGFFNAGFALQQPMRGRRTCSLKDQKRGDMTVLSCCSSCTMQALRYERSDSSRLSRFLIARALANPHFAIMLHWYLFTGKGW
jgi:hypothetical protein